MWLCARGAGAAGAAAATGETRARPRAFFFLRISDAGSFVCRVCCSRVSGGYVDIYKAVLGTLRPYYKTTLARIYARGDILGAVQVHCTLAGPSTGTLRAARTRTRAPRSREAVLKTCKALDRSRGTSRRGAMARL